jgi:hypothetical protein
MERYSDLTDKEKLKISNDLGKLMETKKKVTYKTLSTLDKYKYTQGLNIAKLAEGQRGTIQSQYDSMEKIIRTEEDRLVSGEPEEARVSVDSGRTPPKGTIAPARLGNWKDEDWEIIQV